MVYVEKNRTMDRERTVLIHSYATDHYYPFAVILLESFKQVHGEEIPFLMHTKGMTPERIEDLARRYKNLTIKNSEIDWKWISERSGLSKEQLLIMLDKVDRQGNSKGIPAGWMNWKHYISIYSRYRDAIADAFDFVSEGEHILHLDSDSYINREIDTIFNLIKSADVSLLLRPAHKMEWRRVYGCIMGFTVNAQSRRFMEKVRTHIHVPDFNKIPVGYGQTVFWRAYNDLKTSGIGFASIPVAWVKQGFDDTSYILAANNGLTKAQSTERYNKMYRQRR